MAEMPKETAVTESGTVLTNSSDSDDPVMRTQVQTSAKQNHKLVSS